MLFNTSDPYDWKLKKRIAAQNVYWTVSDMDVCANEQFLIYSTLNPLVQMIDLETLSSKQQILNFSSSNDEGGWGNGGAIMSLKFSGDSKEIVAATKNAQVLVFDIFANRICTTVNHAHDDEINSVCFANRSESNLIFTGSDDSLVKVWDRRALLREAGTFVGHSEGVTHVTSKGDGVLLDSNGKDQLLKVWDIRKMVSPETMRSVRLPRMSGFDYRWQEYPLRSRPF
jgi:WD repeat-containing protein 23